MMMPAAALVALSAMPSRTGSDPLRQTVAHFGQALPEHAEATVLVDFLEDDLREGLNALGDVEAHFTDVLEALSASSPSPLTLVDAGDDYLVLQRLEVLAEVVTRVRRRLSQAAGLMRPPRATT